MSLRRFLRTMMSVSLIAVLLSGCNNSRSNNYSQYVETADVKVESKQKVVLTEKEALNKDVNNTSGSYNTSELEKDIDKLMEKLDQ